MASISYRPTLVWDNDSLVWDNRTLAWDAAARPGEMLVAKAERNRRVTTKIERALHLKTKRGHRRQ